MSRMAAAGKRGKLSEAVPTVPSDARHVRPLVRADLRRDRLLQRDRADAPLAAVRFLRQNSLSVFFLLIFLGSLVGQSIAGHNNYNEDQLAHHGSPISYGRYLTSSEFGREVMENWQSEFLQFTLYLMATIWLVQKGSPESKDEKDRGRESDEDQLVGAHAKESSPRLARIGGLPQRPHDKTLFIPLSARFI